MVDNQWISFKLGSETYAHSVEIVKEIVSYSAPVPVPGSPHGTEGILNVRGNVVTVLSGRSLFGLDEREEQENGRIIILERDSDLVGISVDSVGAIITFQRDEVERADLGEQHPLIRGTVQQDGHLYILTDFSNYAGNSEEY